MAIHELLTTERDPSGIVIGGQPGLITARTDLETWERFSEVLDYARSRQVSLAAAIQELVEAGLNTVSKSK